MDERNGMSIKEFLDIHCNLFAKDIRGREYNQVLFHNAPLGFLLKVKDIFVSAFGISELNMNLPKIELDRGDRNSEDFVGKEIYVVDIGEYIKIYIRNRKMEKIDYMRRIFE